MKFERRLPEGESLRRKRIHDLSRHRNESVRLGVVAVAVRIDLDALGVLDGDLLVIVHEDAADHDVVVVHRPLQHKIPALRNFAFVAWRQDEELASLASIRAGQSDVADGPLPVVFDDSDDRSGRHVDHHRSGLAEIDIRHRIDRGVVRGEPEALGV